jgi:hypothetical protein
VTSAYRREIAATLEIGAPRCAIFAFLAKLENHAALGGGSVELLLMESPSPTAGAALVRLRGPLGIRRTASTAILRTQMPESITGRATIGPRTRAYVSWDIAPAPHGSAVTLRATVEAAALRDRLLLTFGGRWWLERRFAGALRSLSDQLTPGPRDLSDSDLAQAVVLSAAA